MDFFKDTVKNVLGNVVHEKVGNTLSAVNIIVFIIIITLISLLCYQFYKIYKEESTYAKILSVISALYVISVILFPVSIVADWEIPFVLLTLWGLRWLWDKIFFTNVKNIQD